MHLQCPNAAAHRHDSGNFDWQHGLPEQWRMQAIAPLRFTRHRDYEIAASRTLGYDKDGLACFYQHSFVLGEPRSDDDEEFYEAMVHGEEVRAWRLHDERWLVWRVVQQEGNCRGKPGDYSFSGNMPR